MTQKFRNNEIIVWLASLSALYVCFNANFFWHRLLSASPEYSVFSPHLRSVLVYVSIYLSMLSSVLVILFDNLKIIRIVLFLASFIFALLLTENFGYQDWYIHPLVMFNLIFLDEKNNAGLKSFLMNIFSGISLITAVTLVLQLYKEEEPHKTFVFRLNEISFFEIVPGVGFKIMSTFWPLLHALNIFIFLMLFAMPFSQKSKTWSLMFFLGSIFFCLIQRRLGSNDMLGWLLFILPLLFLQSYLLAANTNKATKLFE